MRGGLPGEALRLRSACSRLLNFVRGWTDRCADVQNCLRQLLTNLCTG